MNDPINITHPALLAEGNMRPQICELHVYHAVTNGRSSLSSSFNVISYINKRVKIYFFFINSIYYRDAV